MFTSNKSYGENLHLKHDHPDSIYDTIRSLTLSLCCKSISSKIEEEVEFINDSVEGMSECLFSLQSGEGISTLPTQESSSTQAQNVGFSDQDNNVISSIPHDLSKVKVDSSQNVDLANFLKRPVSIYSKQWAIGNSIDSSTFDPWNLYFSKTSIKKKLDNYYMLRCNLHLKFVINASPFYYGCCLVSYQPMIDFSPAPVVLSSFARLENVSYSQRPHIYLYPQDSQGGEMVLPFLSSRNWLDATSASALTNMGRITLNSFDQLLNANGLTGDSINITVYAWADDVEVSGPTISLALQSGEKPKSKSRKDEYSHEGTISKPASAIARAAGHFSNIPIIGPFATATSVAAEAISGIASLFGYTNVPVIDDIHAFRSAPFPVMATTDIGAPIEKLTLDSKNELTIDPSVAGANVNDELAISDFIKRESFILSSDWVASDTVNTGLFYARVSPCLFRVQTETGYKIVWSTPMDHVGQCFKFWRGDIKFRFKFICTKYHRGRVRINWDPIGPIGTSGDYTTETYTKIVDITEETDVSFVVPYTQTTAYRKVDKSRTNNVAKTSTLQSTTEFFNGIITMRVLNQQTSPVSSALIKVLAFVSADENFEFAAPAEIPNENSLYTVQSGEIDQDVNEYNMGIVNSTADPNINLIYMGEHVCSLRQLMRRQNAYMRLPSEVDSTAEEYQVTSHVLGRSPIYPGFDPNGLHTAVSPITITPVPYNYVAWSYTTWFSACFVGSRGSYIYTVNNGHKSWNDSVFITRGDEAHNSGTLDNTLTFVPVSQANSFTRIFTLGGIYPNGSTGMSLTNTRTQTSLSVLVPMYSRFKFISNSATTRTEGTTIDDSDLDAVILQSTNYVDSSANIKYKYHDLYVAAGTDFSLVFFLNVPAMFVYDSVPLASA